MAFRKSLALIAGLAVAVSGASAQEGTQWIVIGDDAAVITKQSFAGRLFLPDGRAAMRTFESNNGISVVEIADSAIAELQTIIHRNFRRCGGFTVHKSREAALREVNNPLYAKNYIPPERTFPTTIDQQRFVLRSLPLVRPAQIMTTITELQNLDTRYYTSQRGLDASIIVQRRWEAYGADHSDFTVRRYRHGWKQESVIATIRGSEFPDQIVLIGGHLDSINSVGSNEAPGADDDASGVAVVSEILRVLAQIGFKPKRTIQFMAYAAEEVGLLGSGDIAENYDEEGKNVIAALQLDMTGYSGSEKNIYIVTDYVSADLTKFLKELLRTYNGSGIHKITFGDTRCGYACSDHASWTRFGVASAFTFESAFEDYNRAIHTANDMVTNLDSTGEHEARFAKLGLEFMIETAKSAAAPSDMWKN